MTHLPKRELFEGRHIGISASELAKMLATIGVDSLDTLMEQTVPAAIRQRHILRLPDAMPEYEYLQDLKLISLKNKVFRSYIGQGYYGTVTPSAILRNIFQNPGWYTQYTPYQAEIAQGRLEAILNFQTMVSDLTALPITNASLLDEATAAAEAMQMFYSAKNKKTVVSNEFFVDNGVLPQTLDVIRTRAIPHGIQVVVGDFRTYKVTSNTFGVLLQYPTAQGSVEDYRAFAMACSAHEAYVTVAADLLSLALLTPPGEWGADCVVGNSQRFGVPMGYGGPHAAFFSTKDAFKRVIPGRIIGVSIDSSGKPALRMALQTREQHIRREKATSNICTAQALLAIMAGMYGVYHGPSGIRAIAERTHAAASAVAHAAKSLGLETLSDSFFDTVTIKVTAAQSKAIKRQSELRKINFYYGPKTVSIAVDETITEADLADIVAVLAAATRQDVPVINATSAVLPVALTRETAYLTHPVFNSYHTESQLMRYIKRLENRDLSLTHAMISLGSCTMKLNAASELIPVSWSHFANIHPFVPVEQAAGYAQIFDELSAWLCECTGFTGCSLQPNSGAQGEYAGLMAIRKYHIAEDNSHRNIVLIPSSAHGTNPASAVMAGMEVVVTACDESGNIDVADLRAKAEQFSDRLACLMVTYPSTHGVFETAIREVCDLIHEHGGLVYMDGANMNAQVGLTSPAAIGADVCHLNLHKTFAIPHGGGGPGMGPICVNDKLKPHLAGHVSLGTDGAVSAAAYGSASILLISYGYIKMLGSVGVTNATKYAILNANYMKARLQDAFEVLFSGEQGRAAHEMIIDLRPFKAVCSAEDVAKRLMDYGFHAPTLSFPVAGTMMIEPTESEDKAELDRFCDALLQIRKEIDEVAEGKYDAQNNVLHNSPHTAQVVTADEWNYPYSREKAAYPMAYLREGRKFWPFVGRIQSAYGDRNLICACVPIEAYQV